jgi:hypothetical protein
MKKFNFLLLAFCLTIFACNQIYFPLHHHDPFQPLEFTGMRNAMFFLVPDPTVSNRVFEIASPRLYRPLVGIQPDNFPGRPFDQITLHNIPLHALINTAPFQTEATGHIAFHNTLGQNFFHFAHPFAATLELIPNPFQVLPYSLPVEFSYSRNQLTLPRTSDYAVPDASVNIPFSFSITVTPDEVFRPAVFPSGVTINSSQLSGGSALFALTRPDFQAITFQQLVSTTANLVSRNFYQYRHFTIRYPVDTVVFNIIPNISIVYYWRFDLDTNSIFVQFVEYDSEWTGDVISFTLFNSESGTHEHRVIRIQ